MKAAEVADMVRARLVTMRCATHEHGEPANAQEHRAKPELTLLEPSDGRRSRDYEVRSRRLIRARETGVTLIEVLIVVAIMAMIGGGVAVFALPKYREAQLKSAETSARNLRTAVQTWQMNNNESTCPSIEDLVKERHIDSAANVQDPWGVDFKLVCQDGDVIVISGGPDKKTGTDDDISVPKGMAEAVGG